MCGQTVKDVRQFATHEQVVHKEAVGHTLEQKNKLKPTVTPFTHCISGVQGRQCLTLANKKKYMWDFFGNHFNFVLIVILLL